MKRIIDTLNLLPKWIKTLAIISLISVIITGILLLLSFSASAQVVATLKLTDGSFINNAPSGRDWVNYQVKGFDVSDAKDTLIIDDSDQSRISYYNGANSTGWTINSDGCNCSWSGGPWDSLVVKFTNATRFEWWGEKMSHHGKVNIYFNELSKERVLVALNLDTYSPDNLSPTLNWYVDNLDTAKVYKFFLIPTGKKNDLSSGTSVVIQGFKIITDIPESPPVDPPSEELQMDIVRKGYYIVIVDGVQLGGGHSEFDKAVEKAVNASMSNPESSVLIQGPSWKVEYKK